MTERQQEATLVYARELQQRLGLSQWTINWRWDDCAELEDGHLGILLWNLEHLWADVQVAASRSLADVRETVRHELVHLAQAEVYEAMKNILIVHPDPLGEKWLTLAGEQVTRRLARALR